MVLHYRETDPVSGRWAGNIRARDVALKAAVLGSFMLIAAVLSGRRDPRDHRVSQTPRGGRSAKHSPTVQYFRVIRPPSESPSV
jgi:hypothetical protein